MNTGDTTTSYLYVVHYEIQYDIEYRIIRRRDELMIIVSALLLMIQHVLQPSVVVSLL
jgi:hypothetical protein